MTGGSADLTDQVNAWAEWIMAEIDADIARGQVAADVGSFAELHDYVDANEYLLQAVPDMDDYAEWIAAHNATADEVNRRLAARREAR